MSINSFIFQYIWYLINQDAYKLEKVEPVLTGDQLDNAVKPIIQEYLEHGDTAEVEVMQHCFCTCNYVFYIFYILDFLIHCVSKNE